MSPALFQWPQDRARRTGAAEWTLVLGGGALCAPAPAMPREGADFDWCASCGLLYDCGDEPFAAADDQMSGTRAFADGPRNIFCFWTPPPRFAPWYALTGGALLCRTVRLQEVLLRRDCPPNLAIDQFILAVTRQAAMLGDRLAVDCELLALEPADAPVRALGTSMPLAPQWQRFGRGLRASFANDQMRAAMACVRRMQASA